MKKDVSVVIPVYNEKESIKELLARIKESFVTWRKTYEILFIDDGSIDGSFELLKTLERQTPEVKVYSFRKNVGKSYALMMGFQKAEAEFVVTLDADLQDDPQNIKPLYTTLLAGKYDMLSGWRKVRHDSSIKKISSQLFNRVIGYLFDLHVHDVNSGIKIYRSYVVKDLKLYGGLHRFIPLLVHELGYKVGEKKVLHHSRKYGVSKYKMSKVITDIPDLVTMYFLTKYTRRPLHFFGKIGSIVFSAGFVVLVYLSILRFSGESIGRRPLLIFGVMCVISGMQIILTGLIADLIVNVSMRSEEKLPMRYESTK